VLQCVAVCLYTAVPVLPVCLCVCVSVLRVCLYACVPVRICVSMSVCYRMVKMHSIPHL